MKILALDTAADALSLALYDAQAGALLAAHHEPMQRGHAEVLFARLAALAAEAATPLADVDLFAVTTGPGSFTGVRVGLAAARGLALAAKKPILGIGALELAAAGAVAGADRPVIAAFDGGRGELYVQAFQAGEALMEPSAFSPQTAVEALCAATALRRFAVAGSGAPALIAALCDVGVASERVETDTTPPAERLARLAATKPHSAHGRPVPLYLRAPAATLPAGAAP